MSYVSKQLSFIVLFIGCSFYVYGQDKIYLLDEELGIETKILEVNADEIKYKKFDYLDGPTFIIKKSELAKIEFENGDVAFLSEVNEYQKSSELLSTSRIYVQYEDVEEEKNVDSNDAENMAESILRKHTQCKIVKSPKDADFIVTLKVIKTMITNRKAQISITHTSSGKTIYKSKWYKGSPNEFNGFSGTRRSITKIVKRGLLKQYPDISRS